MINSDIILKNAREYVRKALSPARYHHTINVANLAYDLAGLHGIDKHDAALAGLLHDCTKEKTFEQQLKLVKKYNIILEYSAEELPECLHADTGVIAAKQLFQASFAVCDAIKYHTLARPHMTTLEKIIFIADKCEKGRDNIVVDCPYWRSLAKIDLDRAMIAILENNIEYLKGKGITPFKGTLNALNTLKGHSATPFS